MKKWEYFMIQVDMKGPYVTRVDGVNLLDSRPLKEYVAELGEKGWELVSITDYTWVFKRPKA